MSDILSLHSRKKIYEYVETHSGTHLREIGRGCEVPLGTVLYHLDRLESEGMVSIRRDGRYKRYFPAHGLGRHEKDMLSTFRHDVPRRISIELLLTPNLTQRELCERIGVSRSTLSFHVNGLVSRGIAARESWRPENRYHLIDPAGVHALLSRFADSLGDADLVPPRMGLTFPQDFAPTTPVVGGQA